MSDDDTPFADEFPESFPPEQSNEKELPPVDAPLAEENLESSEFDNNEVEENIEMQTANVEKVPLSHIPIKVHFELARVNVTLEELQKMNPGYKLPIDLNPRVVDLTVGGKSIGKGELIEVSEAVGVKIVELY